MSNSLDPDQVEHFIRPNLGPDLFAIVKKIDNVCHSSCSLGGIFLPYG